jgi:hypothetical protein
MDVVMLDRSRADHRLKQQRERQKRYRARLKAGIVMVRIEIDERRFGVLTRLGYLHANATDPARSAKAIEALLDNIEFK